MESNRRFWIFIVLVKHEQTDGSINIDTSTASSLKALKSLQEPPEQQPTAAEFKALITEYCMALGPDTVTLPKGLPFRKERLDALKDINAQLNSVLKTTKL
jgi:hypothetical protein